MLKDFFGGDGVVENVQIVPERKVCRVHLKDLKI